MTEDENPQAFGGEEQNLQPQGELIAGGTLKQEDGSPISGEMQTTYACVSASISASFPDDRKCITWDLLFSFTFWYT